MMKSHQNDNLSVKSFLLMSVIASRADIVFATKYLKIKLSNYYLDLFIHS
ncbi:MAG: hypothetical protein BAJALOKI3v1_170033 [Promethearchaeota archaeon]|nr:MAG: hypothetical protein BAJALOKI3v1_170033 [Candidatus Lokiarchaeota archaeon]